MSEHRVSILEVLDDQYEVFDNRHPEVRYGTHLFEKSSEGVPDDFTPLIQITGTVDGFLDWDLDLRGLEGSLGSVKSGKRRVSFQKAYKHRHDYVCEGFQLGQTDRKLMDVYGSLGDDDDALTPDYILSNELDDRHVIEVTTRDTEERHIVVGAFNDKVFKYESAIRSRTPRIEISTLTVIVVTMTKVYSNIRLPSEISNELLARMRIAVALERLAEKIGLDIRRDEREDRREIIRDSILNNLSSITVPELSHPLDIDPVFIKSCMSAPDKKVFEQIIVKETSDLTLLSNQQVNEREEALTIEFKKNFHGENLRSDAKVVCVMPFIITKQEAVETSDLPMRAVSRCPDKPYLAEVWSAALESYMSSPQIHCEDPMGLLSLALEEDVEVVNLVQDRMAESKKKYHRVDLKKCLREDIKLELAKQGVWGKKYKDRIEIKERRTNKQKGYKWNVPVDDIEAYLSDLSDLEPTLEVSSSHCLELLEAANEIVENNYVTQTPEGTDIRVSSVDIIREWEKTPLFRAHDISADIAYEVAISNKHNCPSGHMILKKLRRYDILLLVSPTNSKEHTFVSVCAHGLQHKVKHEGVFNKSYRTPTCKLFDFVSFRSGKYENAASMPAAILSLASFWAWFYDLPSLSPSSFYDHPEAARMLKLSLLIRAENKAQTEEVITAARYMYMEIFKSTFSCLPPQPFGVLSKVPNCVRSRLAMYLIKRLVMGFQQMSVERPERVSQLKDIELVEDEDSLPADQWNGLLNWMTGGTVPTASKAVNLFYVGYLKDKNENPEGNTDFSLIAKTCEEELSFDSSDYKASRGDPDGKPKSKQFSLECIKVGCEIMERRLETVLGSDWKARIGDSVILALSKRMTSEIASLKASCAEEHKSVYPQCELSTKLSAGRLKVLEAVKKKVDKMGLNPYTHFSRFLDYVSSTTRGVVADLFKKQQHGGLREIYVLTIESRIIQLFVETCSRTICGFFEEETLTHPSNKTKKLDEHKYTVTRISNRDSRLYVDYCSSTDKTRWNQNFVMPAMAVPLLRLLPAYFHGAISRSLNLWNRKMIKLPPRVQQLLLNNVPLSSEVFETLKSDFWKPDGGKMFDHARAQFVRLQTGMMQGILHYTSSLLHLTFLNATSSMIPKVLTNMHPGYKFKCTQVCSSDDSATILSVMTPANTTKLERDHIITFFRSARMLHVLDNLAPYFCMKTSPKSNTANLDNIEFNSEFLFKNTIAIPILKYVGASLNVTEAESFNERFHTMYNLISDLFQSSFPAENTHFCQLAQGYNHYRTMGHSTNPLFPTWAREIKTFPDPSLGFFLIDTRLAPGLLGFSYAHWKAAKVHRILKRKVSDNVREPAIVNSDGGIVSSLIVKHGDVKRWKAMASFLIGGMNLREEIEKNPRLLFYPPETAQEIKVSLAIKGTMPAVAKSMRKGNPYMQALATTAYALSTHCFSKTTVTEDIDSGKLVKVTEKTSLLLELRRRKKASFEGLVSDGEMAVSFPHYARYQEAERLFREAKDCVLVKCHPFRNRKSMIVVQPMSLLLPLSLKESCMHKWFDHRTSVTGGVRDKCWAIYSTKLPWLKKTIKETLENSPFSSYQELANFVTSQVFRPRVFSRVGPSVPSMRFRGQLFQVIKKSQRSGHVLKASKAMTGYVSTSDVISRTCLALSLPDTRERENEVRRILKTAPSLVSELSDVSKLPKREQKFTLIQYFVKGGATSSEVMSTLMNLGCGMVYSYTKAQRREVVDGRVRWMGKGQCVVQFDNLVVILDLKDKNCELIVTNNWRKLKAHSSTLEEAFRELGVKPCSTDGPHVAKFLDGRFMERSKEGTRVIENPRINPARDYDRNFVFKIGKNNISLVQPTNQGERVVLQFSANPRDVAVTPDVVPGKEYDYCWLNQKPLQDVQAAALIHKVAEGMKLRRDKSRPSPFAEWIDQTLRARLCQKGLIVGTPVSDLSEVYVPEEDKTPEVDLSEAFLQEMMEKIYGQAPASQQMLLDAIIGAEPIDDNPEEFDELTAEENEWCHVVNNLFDTTWEDLRMMGSRKGESFRFLHPFWDRLIDRMNDDYPKFWHQVLSGDVVDAERSLSQNLHAILKLKKKGEVGSLSEQGRLLAEDLVIVDFTEDEREAHRLVRQLHREEEEKAKQDTQSKAPTPFPAVWADDSEEELSPRDAISPTQAGTSSQAGEIGLEEEESSRDTSNTRQLDEGLTDEQARAATEELFDFMMFG